MTLNRRGVLAAGLGAGVTVLAASRGSAADPSEPASIRIAASQLTQGGWARGFVTPDITALSLGGKPVPLDGGQFFIGFDRDAGTSARLDGELRRAPDSGSSVLLLPVAPRAWKIENVDAPFHPPGVPDAEFARLRAAELARIVAARAMITGASGWRQRFAWPVAGRVSGLFGAQRIYRGTPGAFHSGLDIAATTGTSYTAPADGTVILAASSPFTLEGHLLMIDHGAGLNSAFLHGSELLVAEGDSVTQGQPIGRVGMTGRATGPHLHWSLKWLDARLDPLLIVAPDAASGRLEK